MVPSFFDISELLKRRALNVANFGDIDGNQGSSEPPGFCYC
jgi:hypothetical protein